MQRKPLYKPSFLLGVDFAGSASTRMINERKRWVDDQGDIIDANGDFARRYHITVWFRSALVPMRRARISAAAIRCIQCMFSLRLY